MERFATVMIDGVAYADETMVVALGITEDGPKRILGLRQGATENAEICTELLEDLRARGLNTDRPMLFVIDGSKALHAAVKRVWGRNAVIQRCQVHKSATSRRTSRRSITLSWSDVFQRRIRKPTTRRRGRRSKGQPGGWSGSTMMPRQACVKASTRL